MTILEQLADYARERVKIAKNIFPYENIKTQAIKISHESKFFTFEFENALRKNDLAFICECKKASPSKGLISSDFPYLKIAKDYELAGADCISVLTEPKWFLGCNDYLKEISQTVSIPCLRKDFIIDDYMIYESKILGASAILLICALLDENTIHEYISICDNLGMSALVEAHNEQEVISALKAGARIIGVNNRNLKDFSVDTENTKKLRKLIPPEIIFVSESGVKTPDDIDSLREIGANAVLIGETLMKAHDKIAKLHELKYHD